jgi:hypothetical protein
VVVDLDQDRLILLLAVSGWAADLEWEGVFLAA